MNEIVVHQQAAIRLPQEWEFNAMERLATYAAQSGLVSNLKPAQVIFIILKGYELNITPMQALADIHLVNGKPGLSVQLMISLANRSGMLSHFDIPDADEAFKAGKATVSATRKDRPDSPISMTFTMEDAKKAGLSGKTGPWTQYPGQMLVNRAVSMVLRRIIPEALSGMYLTEELENTDHVAPNITISEGLRELPPTKPQPPVWWGVLGEYQPLMSEDDFDFMRNELSSGVKSGALSLPDTERARAYIEKNYGLLIDLDAKRAAEKEAS